MSVVYSVGSAWKGFAAIRRLVVFGASYCAVENILNHDATKPTAAEPLGTPFPGHGVWNEDDLPNWIGHLITNYRPGPRYAPPDQPHQPGSADDQSAEWIDHPLLVNDYAKGGDTVMGVARQIQSVYLPGLGTNPAEARWTANDTLFITWVGINDCAVGAKDGIIDELFKLQDEVYITGARNFVFIDLPPIHRSPAGSNRVQSMEKTFVQWNLNLREAAKTFSATHADSSVFIFSSFELFNTLLDDPVSFALEESDLKRKQGTIWVDHIHPTSKVHGHIARSLADFLVQIPANS